MSNVVNSDQLHDSLIKNNNTLFGLPETITSIEAVQTSNAGAIAGGVIGAVVILSVIFGILYFR